MMQIYTILREFINFTKYATSNGLAKLKLIHIFVSMVTQRHLPAVVVHRPVSKRRDDIQGPFGGNSKSTTLPW